MRYLLAGKRSMVFMTGIMMVEAAIASMFFIKEIPHAVLESHEAASKEMEAVERELSRIEAHDEESRRPLEALSAMLMMKPKDVDYQVITIGDFHDGDWIHMTLTSKDVDAIARYVDVLAANDAFHDIRRIEASEAENQISWKMAIPLQKKGDQVIESYQ